MTPDQINAAVWYADNGMSEIALRIILMHPLMFEHYLPTLRAAWVAGVLEAINGPTPHGTAKAD